MALLKRLTLKNFKSFRSAVIPFAPGFTAIMGPNGSGKSNIIDALIFVLGEGRLKLVRASRLKDLVNVKAKDGEAVVSLEIEANGKTYTITRTINKKGQSVYRLDGKRVTRHEIVTLLSSLGISQRGYNFVLQGEVTRLIKMSPQERRQIIDEIAGIAEYEEKKEEAMKKLDDVLERIKEVNIVLGEREEQLRRLKKEKEDAERYIELRSYVASLRKALLLREIENVNRQIEELSSSLEKVESELNRLHIERDVLERELTELESRNAELTEQVSRLYGDVEGGRYDELLRERERAEAELRHVTSRIGELEGLIVRLDEEKERLIRAIEVLKREIADVEGKKREKNTEVNELRQKIRSLEEVIRREQEEAYALQRRIEEIESMINALKEEYGRLREEYGRISGEYNAKLEELKKKEERVKKRLQEAERARRQLEEVERELAQLEEERRDVLSTEKRLNAEYLSLQEEVKSLREEIGALRGASLALKSLGVSIDVLNALLEAQKRGELRGIKGFVASLIEYDKKYRAAIEAAAGRRLFYIVVETAEDAAAAIKFLKKHDLGRATFIPLDRIRPHVVEAPRRPGVLGRALDLVRFDPTVKRAMEYVFGDTLVVENIDVAKELEGVRSVTLDGDIVERSGVMSGGSLKGESVLRIFEAEAKKTELREKELRLKEIINALSDVRRALERIDRRIRELEALRERLRERAKVETEAEEENLDALKARMEELTERMTSIANKISELEVERSRLLTQAKKSGSDLLNRLNALRREYEAKLLELHEYAALLKEKKLELEKLEEELKGLEARAENAKGELESLRELRARLQERIKEIEAELNDLKERAEAKREELERLLKEKEEVEAKIKELTRRIGSINHKISELERERVKDEEKLSALRQRLVDLRSEYDQIDAEPLESLPPEPEKALRDALQEMQSLEPVNLRAIEEYERVKEKVEEARARVKKLEEERNAILEMINEIEKKKREVFFLTFNEIARKFEEVYRELTGGRARLRLTDDDVFNAGLLIEATPKGKSLTNMDALSGGEKALVALAFIFATALYRPAPFYVLDEPDLMLDKLNAERMAKYIKKLSRRAQFIVVSHRDVVLKEADQIIGVYLGKDGSSVVEVRVPQRASS